MNYQNNAILQKIIAQKLVNLSQSFIDLKNKKIIDIGCGTGFIAQILQKSDVLQLDCNQQSLQFAQKFGNTILADFNEAINISQKFDVALSSMALQWAVDFQKTFQNLIDITEKNGAVVFAVPLKSSIQELYNILEVPQFFQFSLEDVLEKTNATLIETKTYAENSFVCLKNMHYLNLKITNGKISKKQLLLLKNTQTLWNIGFFYFKNAR